MTAVGQGQPAVRATIAPGHTSNSRALSTLNDKPTALVWLPEVIRPGPWRGRALT